MSEVVGILLAAGRSERFGMPKLLHPLPDGTPLAVAAARGLVLALPRTLAVVRPGDTELIEQLSALGLTVVENPLHPEGMGTSIAAGIRAGEGAFGWLIALADMPWVRPATIRALADGLEAGASIIAPEHHGRRGHPVGFASGWGKALGELRGDSGARGLIAAAGDRLTRLPTDDSGVLRDVDAPGDLPPDSHGRSAPQ